MVVGVYHMFQFLFTECLRLQILLQKTLIGMNDFIKLLKKIWYLVPGTLKIGPLQ